MAEFRINRIRAIVLLALTSIFLITLDLSGGGGSVVRNTFGAVFRPVEGVTRVVTRPVVTAWRSFRAYDDVLAENQLLQERIAQQEGAAVAAAASVRLSQELLALNGLPTLAGINSVTAQVIGDSPSNVSQTIEINQGSDAGLRVGMPVLNAAGLVGKVTAVSASRALVMLLTDPDYALSVKVIAEPSRRPTTVTSLPLESQVTPDEDLTSPAATSTTSTTTTTIASIPGFTPATTTIPVLPSPNAQITVPSASQLAVRETGVLQGRGPGRRPVVRFLEALPSGENIQVGAPIVSSGGSRSLAPPDVVIGVVSRVVERGGTAGPILEVELVADLSNLSFLRVLLYQPITESQR
ncbi:MAG: rod shape-determining protein MreC [Ilumatobacteraceae bacterium]